MRSPIMPSGSRLVQARECRRFEQQRFDQPSARIAEVFAIVKDQQRMFRTQRRDDEIHRRRLFGSVEFHRRGSAAGTRAGSSSRARSTSHTPSPKVPMRPRAASSASRVLPIPPEPESVD